MLCIVSVLSIFAFSGCSWADKIEYGTYISKTPYIKFTKDPNSGLVPQEVEVDNTVYHCYADVFGQQITFKSTDPPVDENDDKVRARFDYEFDSRKQQLILTDQETGNVYHLDKVE